MVLFDRCWHFLLVTPPAAEAIVALISVYPCSGTVSILLSVLVVSPVCLSGCLVRG